MNWILRQLKQPSTWKGVFIVAGVIGYGIEPELQEQIIIAVTTIIGIIEIYRNEHAIPPIKLVSKPTAPNNSLGSNDTASSERLRESMPHDDGPEQSGFGDR